MISAIASLAIGVAFGLALQKSGLGRYETVVNQFRFKDFTMLKFMLTAIAVGAVGTFALREAGVLTAATNPPGYLLAALVGGLLLGVGMAVAGTCPGTIFAGIGQGSLDYLVPGVLGMVCGSLIFGLTYDGFMWDLQLAGSIGDADFAQLLGVSPWVLVAAIAVGVAAFWAVCRRKGK